MHALPPWRRQVTSLICIFLALAGSVFAASDVLVETGLLAPQGDLSAAMVAGIHRFALRKTLESRPARRPERGRLAELLGVVDRRVDVSALELVGRLAAPSLIYEDAGCRVFRVRWRVLDGLHGEGVHVLPKAQPRARVLYFPDAGEAPEELPGGPMLASGCEVLIPYVVSRGAEWSGSPRLNIRTGVSHREWIYRQAFEFGRHILGYEVQKGLAAVDWFKAQQAQVPVLVGGRGEGGLLALYTAALDERCDAVYVAGAFQPRESMWREPLYRNVFGLLKDFGDAETASLIAPRPLAVHHFRYPSAGGPTEPKSVAAPGVLEEPPIEEVRREVERARSLVPSANLRLFEHSAPADEIMRHLLGDSHPPDCLGVSETGGRSSQLPVDSGREERQVKELSEFCQKLVPAAEVQRDAGFWRQLPSDPAGFEARVNSERFRFWTDLMGRLPDPDLPPNAQSRLWKETDTVRIYEVKLDVWKDVFAWGLLCVPKNLRVGERRPVVVCQHGLEGLPEDVVNDDPGSRAFGYYKGFALKLAERGYVTFAPHNPYRGADSFRSLQRLLNPLGLSLFSVIIGQHQRVLEWLRTQAFVQPHKIAFYGLSYGGKSAMRIPAALDGYCLSICSGDFNEWIRKCVSTEQNINYVFKGEYEMWEWNMAHTYSYAEMAALIAPRPFMVERGHSDGVATDEWVGYEYAKVRRLYDKLGIGGRTRIEFFNGPHTIHGVETFEFLDTHLGLK